MHAEVILPEGGTMDRADLWNGVETHHKRGDATLVREVEVSLPTELSADERQALAVGFARELADRYGVAADVALHAPRTVTDRELEKNPNQHHQTDENGRRHNGNYHAHIMLSACHVSATGQLGKKSVEMDPIHCQRAKIENLADSQRARWAELANAALERAGNVQRIDHRSHAERGIETLPGTHLGPAAAGFERRTGEPSAVRIQYEREAGERLALAKQAGDAEREIRQLDRSIIDLSGDLKAAVADRDRGMEAIRAAAAQVEAAKVQAAQAEAARVEAAKVQAEKWQSMAQSFAHDTQAAAVKKFPELANAYATVAALDKQAEAAGMSAEQRAIVVQRVQANTAKSIERGVVPVAPAPVKQQDPAKPERTVEAPRQAVDPLKTAAATVQAWRDLVATERRDHLVELTRRAVAETTAEVHRHNAHLAAKPRLFGRDKWEVERQGFEARDREMRGAVADLESGKYPSLGADVQAVQQAAEQRASDKNPALAREAAEAAAALQAERERLHKLERIAAAERSNREYERREAEQARQPDQDNDYGR